MKLFNKSLLYFTIISIPILLIIAILSYFILKNKVQENLDENIKLEYIKVINDYKNKPVVEKYYLNIDSLSFIEPIANTKPETKLIDTIIYDKVENEEIEYRKFTGVFCSKNNCNKIVLVKGNIEGDDLLNSIFTIFCLVLFSLLIIFFLLNYFISKSIWKPFYQTLETVTNFSVKNKEQVQLPNSNIKEFNGLNNSINTLFKQAQQDYKAQKEFTENASHEIQTPLAVMRSKINQLMQNEHLQNTDLKQLADLENAVTKLSRLNKSLLLITKIENEQFVTKSHVEISDILKKSIATYRDFVDEKNINMDYKIHECSLQNVNAHLIEILFDNLISNAIKYTLPNGNIEIHLSNKYFEIINTSNNMELDKHNIFQRFQKANQADASLGLGLAIAKSICDEYKFSLEYNFLEPMHTFTVNFFFKNNLL